jgi:hypothetical protein
MNVVVAGCEVLIALIINSTIFRYVRKFTDGPQECSASIFRVDEEQVSNQQEPRDK